jgi:putative ABC transport system permease protein
VARPQPWEPVAAGRFFNLVINRAAAGAMGFTSPEAAIGRQIGVGLNAPSEMTPATIVGVVENTRVRTPRDPIEPILYAFDPSRTHQVIVRYADARAADVMEGIHRVWRRFEPAIPFEGQFAEALTAEVAAAEQARGTLFLGFALLAAIIACSGLYALAAFVTERRTREIGIRKVVGARSRDIVRLLAWQLSKPVAIAAVLALPVAWWGLRAWLNGFDLRVPLGPTPFVVTALAALAVALVTVSGHALRVARTNPIHALREE